MSDVLAAKTQAAQKAVSYLKDGMVVGLGTGSTATIAIDLIGAMVAKGLRITCVATSQRSADQAIRLSIPLAALNDSPLIDVTIDGADQVDLSSGTLIKGRGGALLHEKLIAVASKKLIIVVDQSKITGDLGHGCPVPVEVVVFGWATTAKRLSTLGAHPILRRELNGEPVLTDSGNYILDCTFDRISDPKQLHDQIKQISGVIDSGLFINMSPLVIVGTADSAKVLAGG